MKARVSDLLTPRRLSLFAVPLVIGVLGATALPGNAATDVRPPAVFERVQFADVIEAVQPAVVQITTTRTLGTAPAGAFRGTPFGGGAFEEFLRRFGRAPQPGAPAAPEGRQASGVGSGFIVDTDGHIVTNNHVIAEASEITVTLHDGREFTAQLVGTDPQTDLAVIRIEGKDLPSIAFGNSDAARVGDWVVAIGSPFGFGGSATAGIISARGRDIRSGPYDDFLQIDAPINSGNSGGPVIDASGQVIGVNTAIFSPNGGNIGIGFAIPAADAVAVVSALKTEGSVTRGWLGVQIQGISDDVATALGLDKAAGALVAEVIADAPAERAGLRAGDVIVGINGQDIVEPRDLSRAVARIAPGTKSTLDVIRAGKTLALTAVLDRNETLAAAAPATPSAATADALGLGLALGSLSDTTRRQMRLDNTVEGALVLGVKAGGNAEDGGLQPGDIILRVDQVEVADADGAEQALAAAKREQRASVVLVRRGDQQFFTTVQTA